MLVAGPESDRDPTRALPLARRAVALAPDNNLYLNTLGLTSAIARRIELVRYARNQFPDIVKSTSLTSPAATVTL
jgi:hypothetical protein